MPTRAQRIERLEDRHLVRAEKAANVAQSKFQFAHSMAGVMNGQPILIGHHSERGHRRDIAKMDAAVRTGAEADRQAARSTSLAASAEYTGISIEDSDAESLLRAKIERLESNHSSMKKTNREWRKCKGDIDTMDVSGNTKEAVARWLEARQYSWQKAPFEGYQLSNSNANIRRCKIRLEELARVEAIQDGDIVAAGTCEGKAFEFVTDTADNRLRFESPRLSKDACKSLRRGGFKWSPKRGAWVRLLNENAISSATHFVAPELSRMSVSS